MHRETDNMNNNINDNWATHINSVNTQVANMWNYLVYNKFCEKQVLELTEQINTLKRKNNNLEERNETLRGKLDDITKVIPLSTGMPHEKKAKKEENLLVNEYAIVKRQCKLPKQLAKQLAKQILIEIFGNMNNIEDIIALKNNPNKFNFIDNIKFNRIYNIIPSLEQLNNVIGMKNVKDQVFRSICYFLHQHNNINEMNHIMIMGPPGVGKTKIAQIMAKIYLQLGFLANDKFITANRSDLIGKYLGQTAPKTQGLIDSALGGVLFIDEVYSLGSKECRDSFAKECVDTINLNMSRTDHPWLLIVGGYEEEIRTHFLALNKGLDRRFTVKLKIDGYDATELHQIINSFIKVEEWSMDKNALNISDIEERKDQFKYFAGDMIKLFQFAKEHYSIRMMKNSTILKGNVKHLIRDDFIDAFAKFTKAEPCTFSHMYT